MIAEARVRPARESDLGEIVRLWQAAGLDIRPHGRDAPDQLAAQFRAMGGFWFVAEADGRLVGVVMGTHDSRKGWINRVAVLPEMRRRGIARALIAACEDALRAAGIGIVTALVETDNAASAELFAAMDYDLYPVLYYRKTFHEGA